MYRTIRFTTNESKLQKEEWAFTLLDNVLILDSFAVFERASTKVRFKLVKRYERLFKRGSNINLDDVPFTDEIKQRAMNELMIDIQTRVEVVRI